MDKLQKRNEHNKSIPEISIHTIFAGFELIQYGFNSQQTKTIHQFIVHHFNQEMELKGRKTESRVRTISPREISNRRRKSQDMRSNRIPRKPSYHRSPKDLPALKSLRETRAFNLPQDNQLPSPL
ncbi:hypothetical protein IHE45_10G009800 [Dioscorea alata]|uniref:Uncharacterized protein n=1 Tax=Dioscorea alata TaxID=55571 RepID=A0ACB7V9H0_DIOAL|nr:hypothetical protein IHE45_10G009800 [Dioscorea alata]